MEGRVSEFFGKLLFVPLNYGLWQAGEFLPTKNQRLKNLDTGLSVIWRVACGVERTYRVDSDTGRYNSVKEQSPFSVLILLARGGFFPGLSLFQSLDRVGF